eukprot:GEZU01018818.1.p1 GENE.GEZU01018818.1~~GEZU01018818.1.p1  ORF type:complete len:861 (-),score=209.00 GEZU01018818.1:106-2688(-)
MKFGKRLQASLVPEWRGKFLDYKGLKKFIKTYCSKNKKKKKVTLTEKVKGTVKDKLHQVVEDVDHGVGKRAKRKAVRSTSSPRIAEEPHAGPAHSSTTATHGVDIEMHDHATSAVASTTAADHHNDEHNSDDNSQVVEFDDPHAMFEEMLEGEVNKINDFYLKMEKKYQDRHLALAEQVRQMRALSHVSKKAKHTLQHAYQEHYRALTLLNNYKVLNFTGIVKILKKYDKIANRNTTEQRVKKVKEREFLQSMLVATMSQEVEDIFTTEFANNNRKHAMELLRIPSASDETIRREKTRITFLAGLFFGMTLILLLASAYNFGVDFPTGRNDTKTAFFLYRLLLFPILLAFLLCINVYVWSRVGINWQFIFELDPRKLTSKWDYFEMCAIAFFSWSLSLYLYIETVIAEERNLFSPIPAWLHPIILYAVIFVWMALPVKRFFGSQRFWIWQVLFRIAVAPFKRVKFKDFFVADQLTSLGDFLFNIQYVFCLINSDSSFFTQVIQLCESTKVLGIPLLNMLPHWSRFWQCIRRFVDTKAAHPHLTNAGKYASSIIVVFLGFLDTGLLQVKANQFNASKIIWIVAAVFSTLYKYYWDVYMDWGLCRPTAKFIFLRDELMFSHKFHYYLAIMVNFFLRFIWVPVLLGKIFLPNNIMQQEYMLFLIAFAEIFRRFIWNFYRLENEHINNVGQFRVVDDVPLPFHESDHVEEPNKGKAWLHLHRLKKIKGKKKNKEKAAGLKTIKNKRGDGSISFRPEEHQEAHENERPQYISHDGYNPYSHDDSDNHHASNNHDAEHAATTATTNTIVDLDSLQRSNSQSSASWMSTAPSDTSTTGGSDNGNGGGGGGGSSANDGSRGVRVIPPQ